MNYKEWRELYKKIHGIDKTDLLDDPDWENDIKELYDKAREVV